jgi:hypothetical protein
MNEPLPPLLPKTLNTNNINRQSYVYVLNIPKSIVGTQNNCAEQQCYKKGSAPRSWYKFLSYITSQKDIPFVRIDVFMVKVLSHVP